MSGTCDYIKGLKIHASVQFRARMWLWEDNNGGGISLQGRLPEKKKIILSQSQMWENKLFLYLMSFNIWHSCIFIFFFCIFIILAFVFIIFTPHLPQSVEEFWKLPPQARMGFGVQKLRNLFIDHSGRITPDLKQSLTRNYPVKVMPFKSKSIQTALSWGGGHISNDFLVFPAATGYALTPSFLGNVTIFI